MHDSTPGINCFGLRAPTKFKYLSDKEPTPPLKSFRFAGHHWVADVDGDKRLFNHRILQWSPVLCKWFKSGELACGATPERLIGGVWIQEVDQPDPHFSLPASST